MCTCSARAIKDVWVPIERGERCTEITASNVLINEFSLLVRYGRYKVIFDTLYREILSIHLSAI